MNFPIDDSQPYPEATKENTEKFIESSAGVVSEHFLSYENSYDPQRFVEIGGYVVVPDPTYNDKLGKLVNRSLIRWRYYDQWQKCKDKPDYIDHIPSNWDEKKDLYLFGNPGSGKTVSVVGCAWRFMEKGRSVRFFTCDDLVSTSEKKNSFKYDKANRARVFGDLQAIENDFNAYDLVVIDEIVGINQQDIPNLERLFEGRFSSGKPTVFISNHGIDETESLNGVAINELVGERVSSRMKLARQVNCIGPDLRSESSSNNRNFQFAKKVLHDKRCPPILNFWARNPMFMIPDKKSKSHMSGNDKQRIHKSVWIKGDELTLSGHVCTTDDFKVLLAVIQSLSEFHQTGGSGFCFRTSLRELRDWLGLVRSGINDKMILCRLDNLGCMTAKYRSKARRFSGSLLRYEYNEHSGEIEITLNKSLLGFFEEGSSDWSSIKLEFSYEENGQKVTKKLFDYSGVELLLVAFLSTHRDYRADLDNDKLLALFGKGGLQTKERTDFLKNTRRTLKKSYLIDHNYKNRRNNLALRELARVPAGAKQ